MDVVPAGAADCMSSGDRRHYDTERRFSVTLLRRHAAHLSAPVIRNRNNDAICGVRPPAGTSKSSSGGVVPVGSNLHRGKLHHQGSAQRIAAELGLLLIAPDTSP